MPADQNRKNAVFSLEDERLRRVARDLTAAVAEAESHGDDAKAVELARAAAIVAGVRGKKP